MNAVEPERITALVTEGWELLSRGEADAAALVFGRVLLVAPDHADARRGLDAARAAVVEAHRRLEERLAEADRAALSGERTRAREILGELLAAGGGDREKVAALLDRLDEREGRLADRPARDRAVDVRAADSAHGRWSRRVFAAACASLFAFLGVGVSSTWDGFLARLASAPAPQETDVRAVAPTLAPAEGDRALAEARRRLDAGDARGALTALDGVAPEQPAYPLARQLRRQAEQAAGREATAPSEGAPIRETTRPQ